MPFMTLIVVNLYTIFIEDRLLTAAVFKTMKMQLYTRAVQQSDLMEQVEYAPVINGIWHVQAHYV